jgi:hypothetical protein
MKEVRRSRPAYFKLSQGMHVIYLFMYYSKHTIIINGGLNFNKKI